MVTYKDWSFILTCLYIDTRLDIKDNVKDVNVKYFAGFVGFWRNPQIVYR